LSSRGAVEHARHAELARGRGDGLELGALPDQPSHPVLGVLDGHEPRRGIEHVVARLDERADVGGAEPPVLTGDGELHPRVRGAASRLVPHNVTLGADDHIVVGPAEQTQRKLVGHRAGGHEQCRLLAQQRCHLVLEAVDARVFAVLVVTDLGLGDRAAHLRGRPGHGV